MTGRRGLPFALLLAAVLAAVAGCRERRPFHFDFEDPAVLDEIGWSCRTLLRIVPAHATTGRASLEVSFHPAPADDEENRPGFSLLGFDPDWRGRRALVLDAHNPEREPIDLRVRIDDRRDAVGGDWFWRAVPLAPGDSRVAIALADLVADANGRRLDLGRIRAVTFYLSRPGRRHTAYLDSVRLE